MSAGTGLLSRQTLFLHQSAEPEGRVFEEAGPGLQREEKIYEAIFLGR
jgi:hypothetical protein